MVRRETKREPAVSDWHLWAAVQRTVHPLRHRPLLDLSEAPLPIPVEAAAPAARAGAPAAPFLPAYRAEARKSSGAPGRTIEPRMRRNLVRGHIEIDGTLDLHGMRQHEARAALNRFVVARHARGDRTILVITGKGLKKVDDDASRIVERGVLRAMLPIWLSEPRLAPLIAGWDGAAQGHGGEGAFYVRLRRAAT